jgi:acetylornithine deacetylase/succinyl-diaminopimelate desuccinylase-like protein
MEEDSIHCPGVGDDTACVTAMLMAAKFILQEGLTPKDCGLLLVVDSGEEGLGNLKGIREIFRRYGHRIREFIALDGQTGKCVDKAVGSRRFQISLDTEGGHSYAAFGNRNAIACLAEMITELYKVEVPPIGKTTYNIGTISDGTSVNTIAQHAEMLYEFRSDEREALDIMQTALDRIVGAFREKGYAITVTSVGDRPCGAPADPERMEALRERAKEATLLCHYRALEYTSGSTDCNLPLSMGLPAVCVGCYEGAGSHTREEYIRTDSLQPGLRFALEMMMYYL